MMKSMAVIIISGTDIGSFVSRVIVSLASLEWSVPKPECPVFNAVNNVIASFFEEGIHKEIVFDAYCGVGTIGLCASRKAKKVIGVEVVKEAVINAKENAKINNIKNAEFYHDDATSFIHYLNNKKQKLDVIFMDPPRDGSTQSFIQAVFAIKPKKVVYVSCEPSSLARDLKILKEQYDVVKIQPVDMFPHTHHVESVVLLEFKKQI